MVVYYWLVALSIGVMALSLLYFMSVRVKTILGFFQQEEYDASRFWRAWFKIPLIDFRLSLALAVTVAVHALFGSKGIWAIWIFSAYVIFTARREANVNSRAKKKLNMTERAKRIWQLACLVMGLAALSWTIDLSFIWLWLQLAPIAIMLANLCLLPFQKRINQGFMNEASAKLKAYKGRVIGITGSFGKTTTKHILGHALEMLDSVYYSPGSINTVLGHTRHIRERLHPQDGYFIAEMGAYGIGSIQRLCDFIPPSVGFVTAIGAAHYERFKTLETVAEAKAELAWSALEHSKGKVFLHESVMVYEPYKNMKAQHPDRVIVCGDDDSCDFKTTAVKTTLRGTSISTQEASGATADYMLPILGQHNVGNLTLVVAFLRSEGFESDKIALALRSMPQIEHRLELKETGIYKLLDDAYNSNPTGFRSALLALDALGKEAGGRRICVTPGMVELGKQHDQAHAEIGALVKETCDILLAVRADRIPTLVTAARKAVVEVVEVASFAEARQWLSEQAQSNDVVLIENDLPDLLETRRFL